MTRLFTTLILASTCSIVFSQNIIKDFLPWINKKKLPYFSGYSNNPNQEPVFGFNYKNKKFENSLDVSWAVIDLGMNCMDNNTSEDGWPESYIPAVFDIPYQNYTLFAVSIGTQMFGSVLLISLDNNENLIDAVDIGAYIGASSPNAKYYYPMQWSISSDMEVTTYQLKPTSTINYLYESKIPFPINAQRIDTRYKINSLGKFIFIEEIKYQPQNYEIESFADDSHKIRFGGEKAIQRRGKSEVNLRPYYLPKVRLIKNVSVRP